MRWYLLPSGARGERSHFRGFIQVRTHISISILFSGRGWGWRSWMVEWKTSAAVWRPKTFHVYWLTKVITRPFFVVSQTQQISRGKVNWTRLLISYFRMMRMNTRTGCAVEIKMKTNSTRDSFSITSTECDPEGELIKWMMLLRFKCGLMTITKLTAVFSADKRGENYCKLH